MKTQAYTGTLVLVTCYKCGTPFGLDAGYKRERRKDHASFYCPNGHKQHYPGKNDEELLRDELAREQHRREQTYARWKDLHSTMSEDLRRATEEAKSFRHSPAQKGAFWKGYESRGCALPTDCPYKDNRGGFRRAWFAGAGIEDEPGDTNE